jgi:hypothetical protein
VSLLGENEKPNEHSETRLDNASAQVYVAVDAALSTGVQAKQASGVPSSAPASL